MIKERFFQALALGFLVIYFGFAFAGWWRLEAISPYAHSITDLVFGGVVLLVFRPWAWKKSDFTFGAGVAFFFAMTAGFAVFEASGVLGYSLPFSVKDPQVVLFLLLLGPLLEEWIFRGALWKLFEVLTRSQWPGFLITSLAFSYSQFYVHGDNSAKYLQFMRYQAIYSLGLGLFCGGIRIQFGWIAAFITHLAFNFGFWLGAL